MSVSAPARQALPRPASQRFGLLGKALHHAAAVAAPVVCSACGRFVLLLSGHFHPAERI